MKKFLFTAGALLVAGASFAEGEWRNYNKPQQQMASQPRRPNYNKDVQSGYARNESRRQWANQIAHEDHSEMNQKLQTPQPTKRDEIFAVPEAQGNTQYKQESQDGNQAIKKASSSRPNYLKDRNSYADRRLGNRRDNRLAESSYYDVQKELDIKKKFAAKRKQRQEAAPVMEDAKPRPAPTDKVDSGSHSAVSSRYDIKRYDRVAQNESSSRSTYRGSRLARRDNLSSRIAENEVMGMKPQESMSTKVNLDRFIDINKTSFSSDAILMKYVKDDRIDIIPCGNAVIVFGVVDSQQDKDHLFEKVKSSQPDVQVINKILVY